MRRCMRDKWLATVHAISCCPNVQPQLCTAAITAAAGTRAAADAAARVARAGAAFAVAGVATPTVGAASTGGTKTTSATCIEAFLRMRVHALNVLVSDLKCNNRIGDRISKWPCIRVLYVRYFYQ